MNISFVLLAILCIASVGLSFFAARFAVRRTGSPLAKLASIESKLHSIELSQNEQAETLTQLANRVKMQRVRTAINHLEPQQIEVGTVKDQLRRRAGLTAGKPANHS